MLAYLAWRGDECGGVEQRRQEAEEDDVGRKPDLLDPGHEADHEAGDDEVTRRRDTGAARERRADDDGGRDGEADEQGPAQARRDEGHPPRRDDR